ncbi:MAG TPA: hypothetical protein VIL46_10570, partial [Gemmataceae bacterium]
PLYRSWDAISMRGEEAWHSVLVAATDPGERDTQGKLDKLALKYGLNFVREHPWLTLKRDVVKFFDFWGLERELVAGAVRGYFGDVPKAAVVLLTLAVVGTYVLVLLSGVFGAAVAPPPDRRLHAFLLLLVAFFCGVHTLVFAHSRYHLPVMPVVMLYAAGAWVSVREIWARRSHWTFRLACGICVLFVCGWVWQFFAVDLPLYRGYLASGEG